MLHKLSWMLLPLLALVTGCVALGDGLSQDKPSSQRKIDFDILITRDGRIVTRAGQGVRTKGDEAYDEASQPATLDPVIPFGLIGIDPDRHEIIVDNASVYQNAQGSYSGVFDDYMWSSARQINFSAYYPRTGQVSYGEELTSYSIPYTATETEAGPLVSKTVQKAIDQLNMVPLVFQHITNDIGFKVCDATPMEELQGLIHLRRLTATNVASTGVYCNDMESSTGTWKRQGYYRQVVVFEGDAPVGVGSANEKYVGYDRLVDRLMDSHRYYSVPDEIEIGKQCVEVVFDVEGFDYEGAHYDPLEGQVAKYMLYGLLPDNRFAYGKQYTFHIGLDLSSVYHQITFAPSVGDWETKIYEHNDDF